jgi:hypothetical protein
MPSRTVSDRRFRLCSQKAIMLPFSYPIIIAGPLNAGMRYSPALSAGTWKSPA